MLGWFDLRDDGADAVSIERTVRSAAVTDAGTGDQLPLGTESSSPAAEEAPLHTEENAPDIPPYVMNWGAGMTWAPVGVPA